MVEYVITANPLDFAVFQAFFLRYKTIFQVMVFASLFGLGFLPFSQSHRLVWVSTSPEGEPGNGHSFGPTVSADGRFVAFTSQAANLVPEDTNNAADVFVFDLVMNQMQRVSRSTQGEPANGPSANAVISADGRWVAFESFATNLSVLDPFPVQDIYVHDRLTGQTSLVSVNQEGEPANGGSASPAISADGRYIAFFSAASNLVYGDTNAAWDVFIKDQFTGRVIRASQTNQGEQANGPSGPAVSISGDGRYVAYGSEANNLAGVDENNARDVFVYDQQTGEIFRIPVEMLGEALWADQPLLSAEGSMIALVVGSLALDRRGDQLNGIFMFERETGKFSQVGVPEGPLARSMAMTAGGQFLFYTEESRSGEVGLIAYSHITGGREGLDGVYPGGIAVSADGAQVVYLDQAADFTQVAARLPDSPLRRGILSGRVLDPSGYPLAQVEVSLSNGETAQTDQNGIFFLPTRAGEVVRLAPQKKGYTFDPPQWSAMAAGDTLDVQFIASPQASLEQGRQTLGMPFSFNRGCPLPFEGCGGPFNGFFAGYSTDVVLDAAAALAYPIQSALELDAWANPAHFYRWRNARDPHDLWRFFAYSGQLLSHTEPYQPGDFVFFDWEPDGETDHAALVVAVTGQNRPARLVSAAGVTPANPSGLAVEVDWDGTHEAHVRSHARWNGVYPGQLPVVPVQNDVFQVALGGAGLTLRLVDAQGRVRSAQENSLPAAAFFDLQWEQVISLLYAPIEPGVYLAEIHNADSAPTRYQLTAQILQNGQVSGRYLQSGLALPGEVRLVPLKLTYNSSGLILQQANYQLQRKVRGLLEK